MGSIETTKKPHAVCIPYPAQGHINPMLKLSKLLHFKGFHITFVNTEFNHKRLLKSRGPHSLDGLPDFRFETIPDGLLPSDIDATQDIPSLCDSTTKTCLPHFRELLYKLNDPVSSNGPPVTCIVSDGVMSFTLKAAEEFGVPEVLFWTPSACGFLAYTKYKDLVEKGLIPLKNASYLTNGYLETTIDWIQGMENIRFKDLPSFIRTTNPNDLMVNFVLQETEAALKASAIILNTFDAFEKPVLESLSSFLPPIYTLGPLQLLVNQVSDERLKSMHSNLWKEESQCIDWLDTKKPNSVLYVNFGSITVMTPKQLEEFAWGLANSGNDFLWIIRPDLVVGESAMLPPEFVTKTEGRGILANWCPQEEVLKHEAIAGFLTHSGWNSTLESVCGGVPVICWPFFAEQQTNCWFSCGEWEIGMEIDNNVKRERERDIYIHQLLVLLGLKYTMENLLKDFDISAKNPSEEAQRRWRSAVAVVRNRRRRFRMVADLAKRYAARTKILETQERLRVLLYVQKAAFKFLDAAGPGDVELSEEARAEGFRISPNELASFVSSRDVKALESVGGVEGVAAKVKVSLDEGVKSSEISTRQKVYGFNRYKEKPSRSFWMFVWDAMQDITLIILMVCAVVSVGVGLATEGWPSGMYDGVGIIISIFLVVLVTAVSDYRQSLQFKELDKEKKKIMINVTRDGYRQKVSIYDLVVGDVVHLSIGDQVPADGIFISGYSLLIDESSLSGESEPVNIYKEKPFLLGGTKVQDGSGKMLVTTVGMRTEWGKLMETLSEGGEDETPLQVKLNGVATIIGKIGLGFAIVTFLVLTIRYLVDKAIDNDITHWSSSDALELLDYFSTAVTIIVVAVPEGLPLAVTLSLAFAMKKLMGERALVRHLAACETMGSTTCICTDKTGTLTTNHMVVDKIWICEKVKEVKQREGGDTSNSIPERVLSILLQSIFQNTGSEVVKDKEGKKSVMGTPTESAILEYGLLLGGDFDAQRREFKILKIEPFNSVKKKMSVLVALPNGGLRSFCKGASEIVLAMCDKIVDINGESVPMSEEQPREITNVIESFACEALRTLCLAYKDIDDGFDGDSIPDSGYTLVAVVGIKDPVRPGVRKAVEMCLAAGITVRMVTGDNINTAKAIARECGILTEDGVAIEGPEFRSKSPEELKSIIPRIQVMARSLPLDKHKLVTNLRSMFSEVVAVTGDGTNDAPALHESDIGFAMGIAGTEVAKENADVIILDDNFTTIVNVAKWGRAVYINIQKFVQFQLTVNVVALMINFVSACITGSAPLTAVQLLWVNLIMDTLGALALATEPPNDGLMNRPPVGRGVGFVTKTMWRNIIGQSIYQLAVLGVLTFDGKNILRIEGSDATEVLDTVIFNAFVFCQVFNEINSRDIEKINVFRGMFSSWIFVVVMVSTVAFQAIIVEFLGDFASTVPLSWQFWLLSIGIGAVSLPIAVVLKCIPVEKGTPKHHDGYESLPSGPESV